VTLKNTLSFRILIWNLCRPFSSLSLCCMSCPSHPIMTPVCFAKTEIMNSPSALRSPNSCNFLSESWTGFKPTVSSSFRLLKFSLWFVFSHYNLYAFPHSLLFAREPLNFILFNLMSWVTFCEYYTSKTSWMFSFLQRHLICPFSGPKIPFQILSCHNLD
jgi:hypothetical protein